MEDALQVVGALLILGAFVAVQSERRRPDAYSTLVANAVGAGLLAWLAFHEQQWGFLLLEGCWAIVALWGLRNRFVR